LKAFAGKESDSYRIEIVSLKDAGIDIDIPEPHDTLEKMLQKNHGRSINLPVMIVLAKTQVWK
jgi:hypothetical protein